MQHRRLGLLLTLFLMLLLAAPPVANAESKTLYWKRWDADITVRDNGDLRIVETHVVAFTSGQFHFGLLTLDMRRLESVGDVSVKVDGEPFQQITFTGQHPGKFKTRINEDTFEIEYYFLDPPVQFTTRTIEIAYTVAGATRYYESGDQVYWEAVGALGWPIQDSTATVHLPPGASMHSDEGAAACYGLPCDISISDDGSTVTFRRTGRADGNTPLEVRVQFPHGVIGGSAPPWQADYDRQRAYDETVRPMLNLLFGVVGLALVVGGPLGLYTLWRTRGRDPEIGPVPEYLAEPPSDMPPGIVGTLVDEKADLQDIMATVVDLARRGYLTMHEDGSKGDFHFERTDKPTDGLRRYEKLLVDRIFQDDDYASLDGLKNKFYTTIPRLQDQLYKEVVREGFFDAEPDDVRAVWTGLGAIVFVVCVVAAFALPSVLSGIAETLILIPVGLGVTGLIMAIMGSAMPAKTRKGAEQTALWNAFRTYLRNVRKYNADMEAVTGQFERYLPYAVAFGLDKSWTKTFAKVPSTPMPMWYYPYGWGYHTHHRHGGLSGSARSTGSAGGSSLGDQIARPTGPGGVKGMSDGLAGGLQSMSTGLSSMLVAASGAFTSRPQSSSTSGSWGGGFGGGGFSGGGSSGGHGGGFG
ncbi:MAG: DUF2207 domain-containing protein [Anaerolineae bacterium]|nr:DUF2207 domain-containing protein [Anaerolineae bacterium]